MVRRKKKAFHSSITIERLKEIRQPIYAKPSELTDAVYIDLRSAYYSIVKAYYPMQYWPLKYFSLPYNREKEDWEDYISKLAKVCTFSMIRSTYRTVYNTKEDSMMTQWRYNVYMNDVATFLYDYLQSIASYIIKEFKAIYVHTDGYIVPFSEAEKVLEFLHDHWIGEARIKHAGETEVRGPGAYKIANHTSGMFKVFKQPREFNNLYIPDDLVKWILMTARRQKTSLLARL